MNATPTINSDSDEPLAGHLELSPGGAIQLANRAARHLLGLAEGDGGSGSFADHIPVDSLLRVDLAEMGRGKRAEASRREAIETPAGGPQWLLVTAALVTAPDGAPERITVMLARATWEDGGEARAYYEEMFRKNTAPKLLIDPETGYIADANPAALAFYGYGIEEIRQQRIQDINQLSEEAVQAEWEKARREERRYFEFRHRLASGEIRDVQVYSGPITIRGHQYLHSIIHDVTESRRYQQYLEENKATFEALPVGVYRSQAGGDSHFSYVNPAMVRIFGAHSADELQAHPTADLYRDPAQRHQFSEDLLAAGQVHRRELALQTLDGNPIWGAITAQVRATEGGETVIDGIVEDITEHRFTEQFRDDLIAILEAAPEAIGLADAEGHALYRNPAWQELTGKDPRGAHRGIEDDLAAFFPPWAQEVVREQALPTAAEQGVWQGEAAVRDTSSGKEKPVAMTLVAHRDMSGQVLRFSTNIRDIARIKEAEHFNRLLLESLGEGVFGVDPQGCFTFLNPKALRLFGFSSEEAVLGKSSHALTHYAYPSGEPFPAEECPIYRVMVSGQPLEAWEDRFWRTDGTSFPVETFAAPIISSDGEVQGAVVSFEDITRRKQSEAERDRLIQILEATPDFVGMADRDGYSVYVNQAGLELVGASSLEQAQGDAIPNLHPAWAWQRLTEEAFPVAHQEGVWLGESAFLDQGGNEIPASQVLLTIRDDRGEITHYATIMRDIREQKEREATLRLLTEVLEATPDFVSYARLDGPVLYVNEGGRKLIGLPPSSSGVGDDIPEGVQEDEIAGEWGHPAWASRKIEEEGIPTAMREGYWEGETALIDMAGREVPVSQVILTHRDESGELTRMSTLMRDISRQKELETRLRQERDLIEAIFVSMPGTVFLLDSAGSPLRWNQHLETTTGYSGEEIAAMASVDFFWETHRPRIEQAVAEVMTTGEAEIEAPLRTRDGASPWHSIRAVRLDLEGEPHMLGMGLDITRRRQLEGELRLRHRVLQSLYDITADPERDLDDKLQDLLALGAEHFGLPYGIVSRVAGEDYWIRQAVSPDGALEPGQHFGLGITYCVHTLAADAPVGFHHVAESAIRDHPCYRTQGMEAYLGVPIRAGDAVYGTLNFSSPESRAPYSDFEWELLKLMGQWVSYELTREANRQALERERNLFIGGPTVVFVWRWEEGWPVAYVSPNIGANFGHPPEEIRDQPFADLIHPDDRERVTTEVADYTRRDVASFEQEYRLRDREGEYRWVYDFTVPRRDDTGRIEGYQGYLLDITERRELEAEQRLLATAFRTGQALMITDPRGVIERVNPAFSALTGYSAEEVIGATPRLLASGTHGADFYRAIWRQIDRTGHWQGEIWDRRKTGEIYPQWEAISAVINDAGEIEHYVALFHDISEQKRLEAELQHLARHDRLTGVANRTQLYELLDTARARLERHGTPFAVIMLDIDHFKAINDRQGHQAGDEALRELTHRVGGILRDTDALGRWGGEEFLVVVGHSDGAGAVRLAERIRRSVAGEAFEAVGAVTISLGVAEARRGEDIETLEERVDEALYAAKQSGRNQVLGSGTEGGS